MAVSLSHTWGQIIGDTLEAAFYPLLAKAATEAGVYLDYNGNGRAADCGVRTKAGKLGWKDEAQNWHQLDFVWERGGSKTKVGTPVAFVEVAWRRYTKHSKNKAQEIEGALVPIAQTHRHSLPFLGAILGGEFTKNSLNQLSSRGFLLIHVSYAKIVAAFAKVGIDASSSEDTDESDFAEKLASYAKLTPAQKETIRGAIVDSVADQTNVFVANLKGSISREIVRILILPLHGEGKELSAVTDAIAFVAGYAEEKGTGAPVVRFDIEVRFSNGSVMTGQFPTKSEASAFLRSL